MSGLNNHMSSSFTQIDTYFGEQLHKLCQDVDNAYKTLKDKHLSVGNLNLNHELMEFYFKLACHLFKGYCDGSFKFNLVKIKAFLEKSLLYQEIGDNSDVETNLAKEVKFFFDGSCDLYCDLKDFTGDLSKLPQIFGNAVVLRSKVKSKEYECYFVENGVWVMDGDQLLTKTMRLDLSSIKFDVKSKRALRHGSGKQSIEKVTIQAQYKRRKFSNKSEYYILKRRIKNIKSEIRKNLDNSKESVFVKLTNVVYQMLSNPSSSKQVELLTLLESLIQTHLQLGKLDNLEEYISLYEKLCKTEKDNQIREFRTTKAGLETINSLLELQEKLIDINQQQNDINQFIIYAPNEDDETASLDKDELIKWCYKKYIKPPIQLNVIMFIRVKSIWKVVLPLEHQSKICSLAPESKLARYLDKEKHIKPIFHATVLELIKEVEAFRQKTIGIPRLKSRPEKMIETYSKIQAIYLRIGHLPLSERYVKAIEYFRSSQATSRNSFLELYSLNDKKQVETKTPITMFDILSAAGGTLNFMKCVNCKITEEDLFGNILSRVDRCEDFQNWFNLVHDVDLISCEIESLQNCLTQWEDEYKRLRESCPYQRKYLVLVVTSPEERRYYIRWPLDNQRVHEGFLDQKEAEFKNLLHQKHDDEEIKSRVLNFLTNKLQVKSLEIRSERKKDQFINSIDLGSNDLTQQTVLIYHLNRTYQAIELRELIRTSKNSFACVAKIGKNQYVALAVDKTQQSNALVHVIDSKPIKNQSKMLEWLKGLDKNFRYELNQVQCPLEQPLANNSLLHAYVNASAARWSIERGLWSFLRDNWWRQDFSTSKNIERLKKDYVYNLGSVDSAAAQQQTDMAEDENIKRFDELCVKFIDCFLNTCSDILTFVMNQLEQFNHSNDFNTLETYVKEFEQDQKTVKIESLRRELIEFLQSVQANGKLRFVSVKDRFRNNLEKAGLKALEEKAQLVKMVELFEKELHQSHLDSIFYNTKSLSLVNQQLTEHKDLKSFLVGFAQVPEISIEIKASASQLLEALKILKMNNDQLQKDSFDQIAQFTTLLLKAQEATNWSISEFKMGIRKSYEPLELSEINKRVKVDIYDLIGSPEIFTQIDLCLRSLIQTDQKSRSHLEQAMSDFKGLTKDEKASVLIDLHLRDEFTQALDEYLNSLVQFRTESLTAFEQFETELNNFLISLLETNETFKIKEAKNKLAVKPVDFESRLKTYMSILQSFECLENVDSNFLDSVANLLIVLDRKDHSHSVYFSQKYEYLDEMIKCYYEIGNRMPELVKTYFVCLADRYDTFSNQELFKENGKLHTELLNQIGKEKSIQEVLRIFNHSVLNSKLNHILSVIPAQNEKAGFRINSFLKQTIIEKTKQYVEELLEFRTNAIITFEEFEKLLFNHLSEYAQLKNQNLRQRLGGHLNELINLGEFNESKRTGFAKIYRSILYPDTVGHNELVDLIKPMMNDDVNRKLSPYLGEIMRNLRNLLDNHVNWCSTPQKWRQGQADICQIETKSAILSEVVKKMKNHFDDCFSPNNELRIINSNKLFVDIDLNSSEYSGIKIVIISPTLELVAGKERFKIDTKGQDAMNPWKDNTPSAEPNRNSKDGKDGSDGKPGLSGGHVYVVAGNRLPRIEVIARGGKGGAGQWGGDGSDGQDGVDGVDGHKPNFKWYNWKFNVWSYRFTSIGTDGINGSSGGKAGSGGFAGDPGEGGYVKLVSLDDIIFDYQEPEGETNDSHGQSGKPGEAGLHGRDGRDYVYLSNSFSSLFGRRQIDRQISGRVIQRYRYNDVESRLFEDYNFYDMYLQENHFTLQGKYPDQTAKKGAEADLKHTNRENVKKINSINYQQVYKATSQFFQKFSSPLNKSSFQKWQADKLNEFLLKMSLLEGGRLEHIEQQLDCCSLEVEEMKQFKSQMMSTFEQINNFIMFARENSQELSIGNYKVNLEADVDTLRQNLDQMKQTVKAQRDAIDRALLSNGLKKHGLNEDVANLTRMIAEKRLSKKEAESQHRTEALSEYSREKLCQKLIKRQNLKLLSSRSAEVNPRLYKFALEPSWIISSAQAFNKTPNSCQLLVLGDKFIENCLELMKQEQDSAMDLIALRQFTQVYSKNLRLCQLDRVQLGSLNKQYSLVNESIINLSQQSENRGASVDFLIYLSRLLLKEYQRGYFTVWTKKTLECAFSNGLDSVYQQLKQNMTMLSTDENRLVVATTLLELPAIEELEPRSCKNIQDKCDAYYNEPSNFELYLSIFNQFSELDIFKRQGYFELIRPQSMARLVGIERFLFAYNHNLQFMNLNKMNKLYASLEKIEAFLATMPRSKLHEIMFKFAVDIELTRMRTRKEDKNEKLVSKLMGIVARRDLDELETQFRKRVSERSSYKHLLKFDDFRLEELLISFTSQPSIDLTVAILPKVHMNNQSDSVEGGLENLFYLYANDRAKELNENQLLSLSKILKSASKLPPRSAYLKLNVDFWLRTLYIKRILSETKIILNAQSSQEKTPANNYVKEMIDKSQAIADFAGQLELKSNEKMEQEVLSAVVESYCKFFKELEYRDISFDLFKLSALDEEIDTEDKQMARFEQQLDNSINSLKKIQDSTLIKWSIPNIEISYKKKLIDYLENLKNSISKTITMLDSARISQKTLEKLEPLFESPNSNAEFVQIQLVRILGENELKWTKKSDETARVDFCLLLNEFDSKLMPKMRSYLHSSNSLTENFYTKFRESVSKSKKLEHSLPILIGCLNVLSLSCKIGANKSLEQFNKICALFTTEDLAAEALNESFNLELFKSLLDDYFSNDTSPIQAKMRECVRQSNDVWILDVLLRALYLKKTMPIDSVVNKYSASVETFIGSKIDFSAKSLVFVAKFMHLEHMFKLERLQLSSLNSGSCSMKHLIFENVVSNDAWSNLSEDPNMIDFLIWFFDAISHYEKTLSMQHYEVKYLQELEGFIKKYPISCESPQKKADFDETLSFFYQQVKVSFVASKLNSMNTNENTKYLELFTLFPEYFEDSDVEIMFDFFHKKSASLQPDKMITDLIIERMKQYQTTRHQKLKSQTLSWSQEEKDNLEEVVRVLPGSLSKLKSTDDHLGYINSNSFDVVSFNQILELIVSRFESDCGVLVKSEQLFKVFRILACFENTNLALEHLARSEQNVWLKKLITEHICEKYSLIYHNKYPSQCQDVESFNVMRIKLNNINERALFVLNNLFVQEYIKWKKDREAVVIQAEKFENILDIMQGLVITQNSLDELSVASLDVWSTLLSEMEFNQYFNRKLNAFNFSTNSEAAEKILLYMNRVRVQLGIENKSYLIQLIDEVFAKLKPKSELIELVNLAEALNYQYISFSQACDIVKRSGVDQWQREINALKFRLINKNGIDEKERNASELIDVMIQSNQTAGMSEQSFRRIAEDVAVVKENCKKLIATNEDDESMVIKMVKEVLNNCSYQRDPAKYIRSNVNQVVTLLSFAWYATNKPQLPKDTQLVALMLFIHSEEYGLLEQIKTGEGKTLIVALTAGFMALCGRTVDVVSSNSDLAIEGQEKCHSFFKLLFIDSGHICTSEDSAKSQAYGTKLSTPQGNIVYGEVSSFQRDILEQEFNNKKIFGKRYENRVRCLIVDEVDNMCLDKARNMLYLSHEIDCLKWLESIFVSIWAVVLSVNFDQLATEGVQEEQAAKITEAIKKRTTGPNAIEIPPYLHKYVEYKVKRWVESAFQARMMNENDHFIVDVDKTDKEGNQNEKKVIVVDKDTGVELYSTRWSNGLAQFLDLKYRRKIKPESLKAIFMSNKSFFKRYETKLYGLTGTLGSDQSKTFLSNVYQVKHVEIPTSRSKRFFMLPGRVSFGNTTWLEQICQETIAVSKTRPVLIISENIQANKLIFSEFIRQGVSPGSIIKYGRDGDQVEIRFRKKPATSGDIILATNKGGRGTDIQVDPSVFQHQGMHVILTFLPENVRIEEQAFGRTSRNGAPGTGQFIVQVEKYVYESDYDLVNLSENSKASKLQQLSDVIIEREKIGRDNKETARLSELKQKNILHLDLEESLFQVFISFKKEHVVPSITKILDSISLSFELREELSEAFEKSVKDRWAFWLDEAKEQIDQVKISSDATRVVEKFKRDFIETLKNDLRVSLNYKDLLTKLSVMPEEASKVGMIFLNYDKWSEAKEAFELAIKLGDVTGFPYSANAFCATKLTSDHDVRFRKQLRRDLKNAIQKLENMKRSLMGNYKTADCLSQYASSDLKQDMSSRENYYKDQVSGKLEVIGLQLHHLKKSCGNNLGAMDLIQSSAEDVDPSEIEKAKRIYDYLVSKQVLQGDTRSKWCDYQKERVAQIITSNLDPSISGSVLKLIQSKRSYQASDFEELACSNEELWEGLSLHNQESVYICDMARTNRELSDEHLNVWQEISKKIKPDQVDLSIFDDKAIELKEYLLKEKYITQTKRVKIEDFDVKESSFNGKLMSKYTLLKISDSQSEKKIGIVEFLKSLKQHLVSKNKSHMLQIYLPFGTKKEEAVKIVMFLKEQNIIKSGGLNHCKHGDIKEELTKIIEESEFKSDKDLILSKLIGLQGSIRAWDVDEKKIFKVSFKKFEELEYTVGCPYPSEMKFFAGLGLDRFIDFTEDKSWWDWRAFAVAMLGLTELIAGSVLICFGAVNIGGAFIAEGINDMTYATMAGLSGTFSWRDWAIQKTISMAISFVTAGVGALASTPAAVGSVSFGSVLTRALGQAAFQMTTGYLTSFITEKLMKEVAEHLITKFVNLIEEKLFGGLKERIQAKLELLYQNSASDKEFEKSYDAFKTHFDKALGNNVLIHRSIDNIRSQITDSLGKCLQQHGNVLKNSGNKYAKSVYMVTNALLMANRIYKLIESAVQVNSLVTSVKNLIQLERDSDSAKKRPLKTTLQKYSEAINSLVRIKLMEKIAKHVRQWIHEAVSAFVTFAAKVTVSAFQALLNSCLNNKNPLKNDQNNADSSRSQILKDFNGEKRKDRSESDDEIKSTKLQNDIINPRAEQAGGESGNNRPFERADVKMLANMDWRNIEVDVNGTKTTIPPDGWRKIPALFKQVARLSYIRTEGSEVGHYFYQNDQPFQSAAGKNDCLLIAYNQSLGREVNQNMLDIQRASLEAYIDRNQDRYWEYKANYEKEGLDSWLGGQPYIQPNDSAEKMLDQSQNFSGYANKNRGHPRAHASPTDAEAYAKKYPDSLKWAFKNKTDQDTAFDLVKNQPSIKKVMTKLNNEQDPSQPESINPINKHHVKFLTKDLIKLSKGTKYSGTFQRYKILGYKYNQQTKMMTEYEAQMDACTIVFQHRNGEQNNPNSKPHILTYYPMPIPGTDRKLRDYLM